MVVAKTRNTVFFLSGSTILLGLLLSRINRRWLVLNGLIGIGLLNAGISGFCAVSYLLERAGITKPQKELYEKERLKSRYKTGLVKKLKQIRKEIVEHR